MTLKTDPYGGPPGCLHGEGDEGGDGVRHGQMEYKIVNIRPAPGCRD